jgi:pyrroline-5-carboxylate reductase
MAQEHPLAGKKVGFLGAGMMAGAMIRGLIASGVAPANLMACDISQGDNQNFS